jgi:two-component system, OmpR family, sensor kinase
MSSSRPAEPLRTSPKPSLLDRLRSPRSWSLRTRLLATLIALLAFVCVGIGAGTQLVLRSFLMHQLDQQVVETVHRSAVISEFGPPPNVAGMPPIRHHGPGPEFLNAPGQAVQTLGAVVSGSHVVSAAVVTSNGSRAVLPAIPPAIQSR